MQRSLPFAESDVQMIQNWLSKKRAQDAAEAAQVRENYSQLALRSFYENQRDVVGADNVCCHNY